MQGTTTADHNQLSKAMAKISAEVRDGLKHGHFGFTIEGTIGNAGVRELVIKAGKNHRFRISKEEAEAWN